jgi:hypothetical protein
MQNNCPSTETFEICFRICTGLIMGDGQTTYIRRWWTEEEDRILRREAALQRQSTMAL